MEVINMAKKDSCCSNPKNWGLLMLAIGILYLGQDLGWWSFWTFNWWTIVFLLIGVHHFNKKA
jgi:hypothetical protein